MDDNDGVDVAKFQERIWTNIKDIYKPPADAADTQQAPDEPLPDDTVTPPPKQVHTQLLPHPPAKVVTHTPVSAPRRR